MMSVTELEPYLTGDVRDRASDEQKERELKRASANVSSALKRAGYILPLSTTGEDIKGVVADLVRYRLSVELGLLPEPAHQSALYLSYKMALEWLDGVASGTVEIDQEAGVTDDVEDFSGPVVVSNQRRGW